MLNNDFNFTGFLGDMSNAIGGYEKDLDKRHFQKLMEIDPRFAMQQEQGMAQYDARRAGQEQTTALKQLGEQLNTGAIDRESALTKYAQITGDYSRVFGGDEQSPAALQIYDRVAGMTPEERGLFFRTQRGQKTLDLGGEQVVLDPRGGIAESYGKTLTPGERPETKGAQTREIENERLVAKLRETSSKKISDSKDVVETIAQVEKYLENASGSYLDTAQSFGKKLIGISDVETQANAALKVIAGKLVSNMPRMEGPQSDKDVQLYKDMAANIADTNIPANDKRIALEALKDLNAKYSNRDDPLSASRNAIQERQTNIGENSFQRQELKNISDGDLLKALLNGG